MLPPSIALCPVCGTALDVNGVCGVCLAGLLDGEETQFTLPGLEQLEELARGGMGLVYRAVEASTGRVVAVKIPATRYWDDRQAVQRFMQEARSAALLEHPHILPVYEVAHTRDAPFFTMKFAGGGSLGDQAKSKRTAPDYHRWLCGALAKVADAVQFAHEHGVLHRDLKPANILFDEAGEPYVADFGLAKWLEGGALGEAHHLTHTITALGTPHYLAPEIASGKTNSASTSADVYALGAILYEMLCGRPPHEGESVTLVLRHVADTRPDAPSKVLCEKSGSVPPPDLEAICLKCIEREPQDRYTSAAQLAADLRRYLNGEGVMARPLPLAQQIWRWSRRRPAIAGLAAALIIVLTVSAALQLMAGRRVAAALVASEGSLRDSLVAQSRLVRQSHRLGQRFEALELIRLAVEKGGSTVQLRSEAAAALAEPDLRLIGEAFRFERTSRRGGSVAVTPDFRLALSIGSDRQIALRDLDSGAVSWQYTSTRGELPDEFHLSDSARLAALVFRDHWLEVWDTGENKLLHSAQLLPSDGKEVYYVPARPFCLHPALPLLAGVDEKGVLWLRHLDSGAQEIITEGWTHATAVQLSPDGAQVTVAGGKAVDVWSVSPPLRVSSFPMQEAGEAIAWRDRFLPVADRFSREVVVISDKRLTTSFRGHATAVVRVDLDPDGARAFSLSQDGMLCAWDCRDGRPLWEMQAGTAFMGLHENGSSLMLEDASGHAMRWECAPENVFREFTNADSRAGRGASGMAVSADGRLVATIANTIIVIWDARRKTQIATWQTAGDDSGSTCEFAPDSSAIFGSRKRGGGIFRRDITWENDVARLGEPELVPGSKGKSISRISADGKTWIVHDKQPRLWHPGGDEKPQPLAFGLLTRGQIVSPLLRYISPSSYGIGPHMILDMKSGLPCGGYSSEETGRCQFSPGEHWLVLREPSQYRFMDPAGWKERVKWPCRFEAGGVGLAAVSADGKLAALEQRHDVIDIITLPEGRLIVSLEPPVSVNAEAISFSPDGGKVFVISAGHRLFEWNLKVLNEELAKLGLSW